MDGVMENAEGVKEQVPEEKAAPPSDKTEKRAPWPPEVHAEITKYQQEAAEARKALQEMQSTLESLSAELAMLRAERAASPNLPQPSQDDVTTQQADSFVRKLPVTREINEKVEKGIKAMQKIVADALFSNRPEYGSIREDVLRDLDKLGIVSDPRAFDVVYNMHAAKVREKQLIEMRKRVEELERQLKAAPPETGTVGSPPTAPSEEEMPDLWNAPREEIRARWKSLLEKVRKGGQ